MMKSFQPKPWLAPQPVAIIGTYCADGRPDAMNAAWVGTWDAHQVMISMGSHATTENLNRCPDFSLALATADSVVAADYVGLVSAKKVADKIERAGWTSVKAGNVNAPVFNVFPLTFECRMVRKIDESATGYYIIADIVNILCDEKYLAADGQPDITKMALITYDPIHMRYVMLGDVVGKAFSDGKSIG